jgi:glucoamylase
MTTSHFPANENAPGDGVEALTDWMARQYRFSATAMLRAISATELVKERRGFGQTIRPLPGSVLASPEMASYDPDPDYFFHWLRDSALVMDALRVLIADLTLKPEALAYVDDFVKFSLALCRLDGADFVKRVDFGALIDPASRALARSDSELSQVVGDRVLGEPRFNPDGTLDIIKWGRPQHDGPALRALTLLRYCRSGALWDRLNRASMTELLERDLDFTLHHWREPCFDLWEETFGHHYHTRLVQYAALTEGAAWMAARGDTARARSYHLAAQEIGRCLDAHFDRDEGVYLSHAVDAPSGAGLLDAKRLDIAIILAVIQAARPEGRHSVVDPQTLATLARLEALFDKEYEINRESAADHAPAMGRYAGDVYFSGGAYYFSTLGAAQYYFSFAEAVGRGAAVEVSAENRPLLARLLAKPPDSLGVALIEQRLRERLFDALLHRGDMYMAMVRAHAPSSGELSEQFDGSNGAQTSAKNLAWSYAAFITAYASRRAALHRRRLNQTSQFENSAERAYFEDERDSNEQQAGS